MPTARFNGEIRIVDRAEDIPEAIKRLREAKRIGFDTETRPTFQKGQSHSVALLQLSTESCCYLFRLNVFGLTGEIKELLEDEKIEKIGLSTHDDFHNLNRLSPLQPGGFVELQNYVDSFSIADKSLTKIYAILFGQRIAKGQRLTNWEAAELTVHQKEYAALDAYACLRIFNKLQSGQFVPEDSPYKIFEEEKEPLCEKSISGCR